MLDYLKGREAIYEFFWMAFYKVPTELLLNNLKKFTPLFQALADESGRAELREGAQILAKLPEKPDLQLLNASFTRLFLMGNQSVKLTESAWLGSAGPEAALSVTGFFASEAIGKPAEINLPVDAFPTELYYMYRMAARLPDTPSRAIAVKQFDFLDRHLSRWAPLFKDGLATLSDGSVYDEVYVGLALLASGFISLDHSQLPGLIEELADGA